MRTVAVWLGASLMLSCSAAPDVVAERRAPALTSPFEESTTKVTAPPVEPRDTAATLAALLLATGDVPGADVSPPRQRGATNDSYGASDCQMLDLVRSIDAYPQAQNSGAIGGVDFYNMAIEVGSEDVAEQIMDAAALGPEVCPEFIDSRGPGRLLALEVPSADGWASAGLVIAAADRTVSIGYWRSGAVIAKLRVVGTRAGEQFPVLAQAVADKLNATGTVPGSTVPGSTVPGSTVEAPVDEAWTSHPRAWMILEEADLGSAWTRYEVDLDEPRPGGAVEVCGVPTPAEMGGLHAIYEEIDGAVVTQAIMDGSVDLAMEWIDFFDWVARCGATDEGTQRVTYESVPTDVALVPGADEIVVLRAAVLDGRMPTATMMIGAIRVEGVVVQVAAARYADDLATTTPTVEPTVEAVLRLLAASID